MKSTLIFFPKSISRNPKLKTLLPTSLVALMALPSSAATVTSSTPANSTSNYLQNWNNATVSDGTFNLPAASVPDTTVINGGKTIQVDSNVSVPAGLTRINNTAGTATLEINSGGSLTTGALQLGNNGSTGILNVQGGVLTALGTMTLQAGGTTNISSGSFTNGSTGARTVSNGDGTINLSGTGILTSLGMAPTHLMQFNNANINISGASTFNATGGQVALSSTTALTVNGSLATIQIDRLNLVNASRAATFNFNFDALGISTINNAAYMNLSNATLNIDGSAYTGGGGVFTLLDSSNFVVGSESATTSITGFGPSYSAVLTQDTGASDSVFLTISAVPEPSSLGLLALGGLGLIRRQRLS